MVIKTKIVYRDSKGRIKEMELSRFDKEGQLRKLRMQGFTPLSLEVSEEPEVFSEEETHDAYSRLRRKYFERGR